MLKILLNSSNGELTTIWKELVKITKFNSFTVDVLHNYFTKENIIGYVNPTIPTSSLTDVCIMAPGNSFGFLGGGFDKGIKDLFDDNFSPKINFEKLFRQEILSQTNRSFSPPLNTILIDLRKYKFMLDHTHWYKYIIHVPTMISPEKPVFHEDAILDSGYRMVFNCCWAGLNHIPKDIDLLIMPGFASGYFGVPPLVCGVSMILALKIYDLMMSSLSSSENNESLDTNIGNLTIDQINVLILKILNYDPLTFYDEEILRADLKLAPMENFDITNMEHVCDFLSAI